MSGRYKAIRVRNYGRIVYQQWYGNVSFYHIRPLSIVRLLGPKDCQVRFPNRLRMKSRNFRVSISRMVQVLPNSNRVRQIGNSSIFHQRAGERISRFEEMKKSRGHKAMKAMLE
jgi:hypothetical protein